MTITRNAGQRGAGASGGGAEALEAVRREIDEIDAGLLSLLARRYQAVERISLLKEDSTGLPPIRPSREAAILRRLFALRRDPLPPQAVLWIWREIMGGATQLQEAMRIHLPRIEACDPAFRDLVRLHFGSGAPMIEHPSACEAVMAARRSSGDLAAVPARSGGWARMLVDRSGQRVRVVARMPFLKDAADADGFVLGHAPVSPTEDDETLLAVTGAGEAEPAPTGASVAELWRDCSTADQGGCLWLAVVKGWVEEEAAQRAFGHDAKRGLAVHVLGRYASPF